MTRKVSILIPAYNEQDSLPKLYERLRTLMDTHRKYQWEVLFVNDGSHDHTLAVLIRLHERDLRINYVDMSRNYGKEAAMLAGFDYVTGDCMVIMDADLQHPPELIPEMTYMPNAGREARSLFCEKNFPGLFIPFCKRQLTFRSNRIRAIFVCWTGFASKP